MCPGKGGTGRAHLLHSVLVLSLSSLSSLGWGQPRVDPAWLCCALSSFPWGSVPGASPAAAEGSG